MKVLKAEYDGPDSDGEINYCDPRGRHGKHLRA